DLVEVVNRGRYDFGPLLLSRYRLMGRIQVDYPQCGDSYWLSFYGRRPPVKPGPQLEASTLIPHPGLALADRRLGFDE
ncbi:MAG: hypothetical protein ACREKE_06255, partial [bacterium]